jgi:hypothetical protein
MLGESVETIICRLEGDVTDLAASKYLMTCYVIGTSGYQKIFFGGGQENFELQMNGP